MTRSYFRSAIAAGLLALAGYSAPAFAQNTPDRLSEAGTCPAADTMAEPANQPDPSEDATAPENTGTTGWSGGTGGSQLGTNIQGATDSSPTWQPPTARGLDLAGLAEPVAQC
ncbi:hypothetical protein E4191_16390 (plasmid) [Paracoccus liaowanqingii]|uniref:Uncharacterized protein n=1 Tax=Paracoccus liaowanqingii TaxID=2560053 RepID=A0A4Y5SQE8_9RHOB|nr:hypothetical protein E4191_16390 [Paracoccus liaowanqingii]